MQFKFSIKYIKTELKTNTKFTLVLKLEKRFNVSVVDYLAASLVATTKREDLFKSKIILYRQKLIRLVIFFSEFIYDKYYDDY